MSKAIKQKNRIKKIKDFLINTWRRQEVTSMLKDCQNFMNMACKHPRFKSFWLNLQMPIVNSITHKSYIKRHRYIVNGKTWNVIDTYYFKYTFAESEFHVRDYHCFFNKKTGFTIRFGKTIDEEPKYCDLGPEILDLEISVNGCPKVGGHNCKFCYKNNSDKPPTNMSFETFKKIFDSMPKCLYSIAFGITGVQTNPDFLKMLMYCRQNDVIPNYTLSGADLDDTTMYCTTLFCGAVAVSCYQGNKQLCYDTINRMYKESLHQLHVNMHIVLSEDPVQLEHIWDVLNDIKDKKVEGLRNIVFLRIKPVGRAANMNCKIHLDTYRKIMSFCLDNHIGFGFDSCSAKTAAKVLKELGHEELVECCESCESSKFSSYIAVDGRYWNCSFCERSDWFKPINVLDYNNFIDVWHLPEVMRVRNIETDQSCPVYDLDSKE